MRAALKGRVSTSSFVPTSASRRRSIVRPRQELLEVRIQHAIVVELKSVPEFVLGSLHFGPQRKMLSLLFEIPSPATSRNNRLFSARYEFPRTSSEPYSTIAPFLQHIARALRWGW